MKIQALFILFSSLVVSCKKKVTSNEPINPEARNTNSYNSPKHYENSFRLTQINTENNGSVLLVSNLIGEDYDFIEYAICPINPEAGDTNCEQAKKSPMVSAVPTQIIHKIPSKPHYIYIRSCRNGSEKKCSPYKIEIFENSDPPKGEFSDLLNQGDKIFAELLGHCKELKNVIKELLKKYEINSQQRQQLQNFQSTLDSENCAYILTTSEVDHLDDIFPSSNTGGDGSENGVLDPKRNGEEHKSSIAKILGLASVPIVTGVFGAYSIYKAQALKPTSSRKAHIARWNFFRRRQSGAAKPIPASPQKKLDNFFECCSN